MNTLTLPGPLVSVAWLSEHLDDPRLVVLDASMKPVTAASPAPPEGEAGRIPGARVFDFDTKVCDRSSPLPHMMPTPELFEREARALGVRRDSIIVVYDRMGVYSSPRAWWMWKAMGHDAITVLDGGLPGWIEAGLPCAPAAEGEPPPGDFVVRPRPLLFCDAAHVEGALADDRFAVIDARSEGRFRGAEPEPRAGLRLGHMPNARNLPWSAVQSNGRMLPREQLTTLLTERASPQQRLIVSCGSGVTACVLALAADLAGYREIAVYDGSWSEWGQPSARPVVTG
jgi:thiosulfate/3-mercaptopyruvate sulfurtransferase